MRHGCPSPLQAGTEKTSTTDVGKGVMSLNSELVMKIGLFLWIVLCQVRFFKYTFLFVSSDDANLVLKARQRIKVWFALLLVSMGLGCWLISFWTLLAGTFLFIPFLVYLIKES